MAWRGLALVLVSIAGLIFALKAPGLVLQAFVVASFALLGVFAALLVVGRNRPSPFTRWTPMIADGIRGIRNLASGGRPTASAADRQDRIDVVPWDEDEDDLAPVATLDEHATARQLTDRLVPRVAELVDELGPLSPQEAMMELRREGDDLRSLARLLRLDLTAYGTRISRGLAAARAGRFEECALALQVANERLRAEVQAALEKELPRVQSHLPFRR
jgi:hypothetical protein